MILNCLSIIVNWHLQRRYPDLNFTEDDLKNAEKEFESLTKNEEDVLRSHTENEPKQIQDSSNADTEENKKTI